MQFSKSRILIRLTWIFLLGIILSSLWVYTPLDPVQLINIIILIFLIAAAYLYMKKVPSRKEISPEKNHEKKCGTVLFDGFAYLVCEDKYIAGRLSASTEYVYFTASEPPFDPVTLEICRADLREITPAPPSNLILTDIDDREWQFSLEDAATLTTLLEGNVPQKAEG